MHKSRTNCSFQLDHRFSRSSTRLAVSAVTKWWWTHARLFFHCVNANIKTKSLLRHNRICGQNYDSDQNFHKCDQCTYSTHRSRNLRIHKKSRHTVKLEVKQEPMIAPKIYDTKMKEKMKCQNCSYESRDNWNLERHKVSCRNQEQHVLVFI